MEFQPFIFATRITMEHSEDYDEVNYILHTSV